MELYKKIILGIIQGITELLPISSTGHLVLAGDFLNQNVDLGFMTFLHFCTVLAIMIGFRKEIWMIIKSKSRFSTAFKMIIAIITAGTVGVLFGDFIDQTLQTPLIITISLIFWGAVMILIEKTTKEEGKTKTIESVSPKQSIFIGLAQTLALVPGTSRSGISILSGLSADLNKHAIGGLFAFVFGILSIILLKRISNKNFLSIFGIYRILLGIGIIASQFLIK
jgi:undecaprenyl-diphosphatase